MIHGSHFQITFEFAEGLFDIQQALVMAEHLGARTLLDRFVGVQQKPPVPEAFLSDEFLFTLPLEFSFLINPIRRQAEASGRFQAMDSWSGLLPTIVGCAVGNRLTGCEASKHR